jgi:hypothetical protein
VSLTYVALLPLPLLCPSVQLSIGVPAISLNASFNGAVALNASLTVTPPTVALYLSQLESLQAQLSLGISLGAPSVSFTLSDTLTLVASLEAAFSLLVTLEGLLNASIGMYAFTYSGIASGMGAALTTELATQWPDSAPTSTATNAIILGAVAPIAQTQLAAFLNGLTVASGLVYTAKMTAMSSLSLVTAAATAQGNAAIQAQLDAALKVKVAASVTPPSLAITAEALGKFAANLRAQLNLAPPKIQAALSATANLSASLSAKFGLMIALGATLDRYDAELFCYTYSGTGAAMGAAVTTSLASTWGDGTTPTTGACVAAILATTDSFTYGIMTGFFGGV